jgi:hypothetical protein
VGAWRDRAQAHHEVIVDPAGTAANLAVTSRTYDYTAPPDGWPGDIVNSTGARRDEGYGPETCSIGGQTAEREWAVCHPTRDGELALSAVMSFDSDAVTGGEFRQPLGGPGGARWDDWRMTLAPNRPDPGASDCWTFPILVWVDPLFWEVGDVSAFEDYTGRCGDDAAITLHMSAGPGLFSAEEVLLPAGNLGQAVATSVSGVVADTPPARDGWTEPAERREFVRDVDAYAPYGPG